VADTRLWIDTPITVAISIEKATLVNSTLRLRDFLILILLRSMAKL